MDKELQKQVIVAATAAKVAGFDSTYSALLDLLKTMRSTEGDPTSEHCSALSQPHTHS
jgi:hypothetical protein